ncbi:hypothetical protein ACWD4G_29450 [Streptomyces sp. NPDC002643]
MSVSMHRRIERAAVGSGGFDTTPLNRATLTGRSRRAAVRPRPGSSRPA